MSSTGKLIANNALWKYLELFSVMGIQLLCTTIMARYLTPEDYGILGMVLIFSALGEVFVNSGFVQTIIREKNVTRTDYSTIFYFNIGISILLYLFLYFLSTYIADFYEKPILVDICKVAFLVLPLNALSIVQMAKLQRELKFKKIFYVSFFASLISAILAIAIAYFYKNVWALVLQVVMTVLLRDIFLWFTTDFIPELKFSIKTIITYFKFSRNLLMSGLLGTIFSNIYSLIIGKVYSVSELGFYSQAIKINNLASQTTTQVVQTVTFPILSKLHNEGVDIKDGYKKIISVTLIIVGFVMAMLMSCAQDFFELFLGNAIWRTAGVFFLLIGINGILYPLHCINQNILLVKGDSKTILLLEIFRRCIMILILLVTIKFSINVFVFGISIYSVVLLFINLHFCGKPINYSVKEQLKDCLPIFVRLLLMIVISYMFSVAFLPQQILLRFISSILICLTLGFLMFRKLQYVQDIVGIFKTYLTK